MPKPSPSRASWTLPLDSDQAILAVAGGKGANLARLKRAGFRVPGGFLVTTGAYRDFVAANRLEKRVQTLLPDGEDVSPGKLEKTSAQIRALFAAAKLPPEIRVSLEQAYANLQSTIGDQHSVAVRSSATAEDLPDLSFAGQQDTYLNVVDADGLLAAVVRCWGSLWTARAIGYRSRNHIPQEGLALAVVVQEMVPSEVSGVLFTANPLTGLRSESVIEATFGLGEALVSGQVEPDYFVVDAQTGELRTKMLGSKATSTRGKAGGGVKTVREKAAGRQTLQAPEIAALAERGQAVQKEYGAPQDIEWALAGGELYLLQSRAITSLFPVPEISFDPLKVWFSFGAVQGMVGPMTPLGLEAIQRVVVGAGTLFDLSMTYEKQSFFVVAGERIWAKISDLVRHPLGRRVFGVALDFIEPSIGQIMKQLVEDPRLGAGRGKFKFGTLHRLAGFFLPVLPKLALTMLRPEEARRRFDTMLERYLQTVRVPAGADRFESLANFATFMKEGGGVAEALPYILPRFLPVMAPAMAALNSIGHLLPRKDKVEHGFSMLALEVTRGLPQNVTTEMDLQLWQTADAIRADAKSARLFRSATAPELARRTLGGTLPSAAQAAVTDFLERYGMRGVGEIDLGQPRWRDDPTPVMNSLQSYLQIDPADAPDVVFAKGEKAAEEAIEKLAAAARRQPGGWLKEKLLRGAARRVRVLMGARESPKFFAVQAMGIVRAALLGIGQEFAAAGTIERADDLVFLHVAEMEALSKRAPLDWKALVAGRRANYERELRRRQVPRVLVSDGRAFYEGVGAETDGASAITGSPVSAGVVEGIVHVVLDPHTAQLVPGEILVCPGTDPAWTPLFMAAGGLVMEVGGMMTHGSVVAREYGIPAVVGVHRATERLHNGQKIRVDGTTGKIVLLK
jgi:pyruvate,water dikinase